MDNSGGPRCKRATSHDHGTANRGFLLALDQKILGIGYLIAKPPSSLANPARAAPGESSQFLVAPWFTHNEVSSGSLRA